MYLVYLLHRHKVGHCLIFLTGIVDVIQSFGTLYKEGAKQFVSREAASVLYCPNRMRSDTVLSVGHTDFGSTIHNLCIFVESEEFKT